MCKCIFKHNTYYISIMFKNVIFFAHRAGQRRKGVEKTPLFLKSLIHPYIKQIETKVSTNQDLNINLYNLYQKNVLVDGPKVNIGGDHSMSIATVADSIRRHEDLKVIWMDAHCDINTYKESKSKNYHGMPLSILTGLEKESSLNFINRTIDFKNILYIGVRDIDPFEKEVMEKYNIKHISIEDIHNDIKSTICDINSFVKNSPIHFSFDVDVLDPNVMPSTGTPVECGLELEPCKLIVDELLRKNLVSVDITELNLTIGHVQERAKSLINLTYLFKNYIF